MEPFRVVEGFDVVEDCEPCFLSSVEVEVVEPLGLYGVEEALGDGVVDTAPRAAGAGVDPVLVEPSLVLGAEVDGGFKWSSQRCCVSENVGDRQELRQVSSSLRFFEVGR